MWQRVVEMGLLDATNNLVFEFVVRLWICMLKFHFTFLTEWRGREWVNRSIVIVIGLRQQLNWVTISPNPYHLILNTTTQIILLNFHLLTNKTLHYLRTVVYKHFLYLILLTHHIYKHFLYLITHFLSSHTIQLY